MKYRFLVLVATLCIVATPLAQGRGNRQPQTPASAPSDEPRVAQMKTAAAGDIDAAKAYFIRKRHN